MLLNIGSSMLIPLAVFWPYYRAFIPETFLFPIESLYDGLWFSRLAIENQLLFSLLTVDLFSKLIPHLEIYTSLARAATLIRQKHSRRSSSVIAANQAYARQVRVQSAKTGPVPDAVATDILGTPVPVSRASRWKEYNCYQEGTVSSNESSWTRLNKETLVYLGISHCPELKVLHALQNFPNLLDVKFHNTTVVEWMKENSISASKHTKMIVLVIARTNMSELPEGILGPLPPSLMNVELSHTNLTSLSTDLHEKWHSMTTVYLEHSLITELPETLLSLQAIKFSLPSNLIESAPEISGDLYLVSFTMSANPLKKPPEKADEGTVFSHFSAENTLVKELPV